MVSRTSLSHVHSDTEKLQIQNANVLSFAKRVLYSFPRDRWRNCRLNSSNSIGSECCLEFVIFSQPEARARVMIIYDWVTIFILVHGRFTRNGYALPVPHVPNHKMDLQWKPQSNLNKQFSHLYYMIRISTALQCLHLHMQISDTKTEFEFPIFQLIWTKQHTHSPSYKVWHQTFKNACTFISVRNFIITT